MRIHQLSIQGFGPFAGTEQIDFDELGSAGLFLLDGPTGAGKSSILDAICYAIYGSLPGNRQGSRQIRSDHAAEGLNPEVRLELSIGERRFEVTRSPAWMRPSKRGKNKVTEEKAKSSLRELVDGQWQGLSTRNDEVGLTLGTVLGLDREQFTKVVMLPQGGFADFLRAKDTEREKLLARLFDTRDYAAIEEEFATRLAAARKDTERIEHELAALENQLRSDAGQALASAGVHPTAPGEPDPDFGQLEEQLAAVEASCAATTGQRKGQVAAVRRRHTQLDTRRRIFDRLAELRQIQKEHAEGAEAAGQATAALDLDAKAVTVRAYQRQAHEATGNQAAAEKQLLSAFAALRAHDPQREPGRDHATLTKLATEREEATGQVSVIRAALPDEERRTQLAAEQQRLNELATTQRTTAHKAETKAALLAAERTELETQDLDEVAAATEVHQLQQRVQAATQAEAQVGQRDAAADKLEAARDRRSTAAEALARKQDSQLQAQRQLLAQGAVRLAAALEPGEACLVCGSTEHPNPARAAEGVELVDEQELEALEAAVTAQREIVAGHDATIESLRTTHQGLVDQIGELTRTQAAEQLAEASTALDEATKSRKETTARARRLGRVLKDAQSLTEQATIATLAATTAAEQAAASGRQLAELDARLASLRGDHTSLAERLSAAEEHQRIIGTAHQRLERWMEAAQAATTATGRWHGERDSAGFATDESYRAALLEPETRSRFEKLQTGHQRRAAAIETLGASADVTQALALQEQGVNPPTDEDLAAVAGELAAAEEQHELARQAQAVAASAVGRLHEGRDRLAKRIEQTGPVIESFRRLKALAEVVRGGGENRLKMTLSTYVLAARLEEVAAAATERLQVMSSGRYSLHHDDAARGNAKSGLGIRVHDAWTGKDRETQTLSGGETFMASLALALGLADVISHHSGAVDMQTLFVDEGFGSLDTETLELVMEALESLRSGGRVIGVVSHVSEMKQRITNRLTVHKTRDGSTVLTSTEEVLLG